MKQLYKCIILFIIFGVSYYVLEIIYDGTSHWGMIIVGGLSGVIGGLINEYIPKMKIWKQTILITVIILLLEYISGYILNIRLKLDVWDYSHYPFHLHGQICLSFAFIWYFIFSPLIIWLDDLLRNILFGEERTYTFKEIYKYLFTFR